MRITSARIPKGLVKVSQNVKKRAAEKLAKEKDAVDMAYKKSSMEFQKKSTEQRERALSNKYLARSAAYGAGAAVVTAPAMAVAYKKGNSSNPKILTVQRGHIVELKAPKPVKAHKVKAAQNQANQPPFVRKKSKNKPWYNTVGGSSAIGGAIGGLEGAGESAVQKIMKLKEVTPVGRNAAIGAGLGLAEGVAMDRIRKAFANHDAKKNASKITASFDIYASVNKFLLKSIAARDAKLGKLTHGDLARLHHNAFLQGKAVYKGLSKSERYAHGKDILTITRNHLKQARKHAKLHKTDFYTPVNTGIATSASIKVVGADFHVVAEAKKVKKDILPFLKKSSEAIDFSKRKKHPHLYMYAKHRKLHEDGVKLLKDLEGLSPEDIANLKNRTKTHARKSAEHAKKVRQAIGKGGKIAGIALAIGGASYGAKKYYGRKTK